MFPLRLDTWEDTQSFFYISYPSLRMCRNFSFPVLESNIFNKMYRYVCVPEHHVIYSIDNATTHDSSKKYPGSVTSRMRVNVHLCDCLVESAAFIFSAIPPSATSRYWNCPLYAFSRCQVPSPQGLIDQYCPQTFAEVCSTGVDLSCVNTSK